MYFHNGLGDDDDKLDSVAEKGDENVVKRT